jgi:hypothetical protein
VQPTKLAVLLLFALPVGLLGQATAEHAAASSVAATAASPVKSIGKRISSALDSAGQTLDKAGKPQPNRTSPSKATLTTLPPSKEPPKPAVSYEGPEAIQVGMEYAELLRRFGQPATMITTEDGAQALWYSRKDHAGELPVTVRGNKVVSVGSGGRTT